LPFRLLFRDLLLPNARLMRAYPMSPTLWTQDLSHKPVSSADPAEAGIRQDCTIREGL
jgi:hypothetical protein